MPDNGRIGIAGSLDQHLQAESKDLLRFLTCGSVDDGKSTLVGRLLFDSELVYDDEIARAREAGRYGPSSVDEIDLSLLVDGLLAEREQGITIDVAYRYFATKKRNFIVADTPGHEQYTRNMATGASTAQLAVLLVDARKGLLTQTHRHSYIVSLLGIRNVVLAVNKMDLVGWDQATFEQIAADYRTMAGSLGIAHVACIPLSALKGDNVLRRSDQTPWYDGPSLMQYLEDVQVSSDAIEQPFRLPVQWVNRPNQDLRGYSGTVVSGSVKPGDPVLVMPSGETATVSRIVTMDGELACARAEQAVTLLLSEEIDVGRGDVIAAADAPTEISDQFAAHLVWMSEEPLLPGRPYLIQLGTNTVGAQVTKIKHKVDVNTQAKVAATHLDLNEVAVCNFSLDRRMPFDAYADNRDLGGFVVIDRLTNATVGCGMIDFGLRRGTDIRWQSLKLDKEARAKLTHQKPCVLWFTGLSGAGKSTVADLVEQELYRLGHHTTILDGDNLRHGLNKDLGFTPEDRVENIRRAAEVAKLMVGAGLIVLVSLISPFRSERHLARGFVEEDEFLEIFVDASLEVCEARDPKGLYRKARAGQIPNFTGIGSPYEPPENPELRLAAGEEKPEALAAQVIALLKQRGAI